MTMSSAFDRFYDTPVTVSGAIINPDTDKPVAFSFNALALFNHGNHSPAPASAFGSVVDFDSEVCIRIKDWALLDSVPRKGFEVIVDDSAKRYVIDSYTCDDYHYCINLKTAEKKNGDC